MESSRIKRIVFRTCGGGNMGYGHYYRCTSLAKALTSIDSSLDIKFIINKELSGSIDDLNCPYFMSENFSDDIAIIEKLKPHIIIFDSYLANNVYLEKLTQLGRLVIFDDNNDNYDSSIPDMIINGNLHAKTLQYNLKKDGLSLLGTDYLVLKPEYWSGFSRIKNYLNRRVTTDQEYQSILITTGGSDQYEISIKLLRTLLDLNYKKRVIIGPNYSEELRNKLKDIEKENFNIELIYTPKSLKEYIRSSEVVITAGGSTVYEVLSQGKIPIVFSLADNQDLLILKLNELGCPFIGKYPNINYTDLLSKIKKSLMLKELIGRDKLNITIDGKGALRIANEILKLSN